MRKKKEDDEEGEEEEEEESNCLGFEPMMRTMGIGTMFTKQTQEKGIANPMLSSEQRQRIKEV